MHNLYKRIIRKFKHRNLYQSYSRLSPYRKNAWTIRLLNNIYPITFFLIISIVLTSLVLFFWYSKDLPTPEKVKRKEGFSTVIFDREQKPIYDIYEDKNRIPISFSDLPSYLKYATIAIEDKNFYKHQGFDPFGIVRSLYHILTFRGLQGGSTLTQQLVKNVLLTSERTLPRKIKEFVLAVQIERKYSKDEILQMYLNEAPYGGTMWGIESAAQGYFEKNAKDLNIVESVILAGLPQRPSYYTPYGLHPKGYIKRSEEVLRRMREDGYLTQVQEVELKRDLDKVVFASSSGQLKAAHFIELIKKQLTEKYNDNIIEKSGLRVFTTLDSKLQEKVEAIVKEEVDKLKKMKVSNGAALVLNPKTGEILAYVGSKDFSQTSDNFQGKFDVVSQGFRQPGSALKPITYAVALNKGFTAASLLMDVETHFPGGVNQTDYIPKNYDDKYRGPVQIRYALANSINIPAVKITALIGIKDVLKTSYDMGISTLEPTDDNVKKLGLSFTLGGGEVNLYELTSAYGVFAAEGIKHDTYAISKITDQNGKILYEHKTTPGRRVFDQDISFIISDILSDNNSRKDIFGPNSYLYIPGKDVAVKTGTTDDKRDNWTIGYTKGVVVGVWVGNNDNSPMDPKLASGVTGAAPIWHRIIKESLSTILTESFPKSDNIIKLDIDAYAGGFPHKDRPTRSEYFIKGTEPTNISNIYKKIKLSKQDQNKLANNIEIATGDYLEKDFIVFSESDPTSLDEKVNLWQQGIDKWVSLQNDLIFHPPTTISNTNEDKIIVDIVKPENNSQTSSNDVTLEVNIKSNKEIGKVDLYLNDILKSTYNTNYISEVLNLDTGIYTIKIKAYDKDNHFGEAEIRLGVNMSPLLPTPTLNLPSPTAIISEITPSPTITQTPTLTPV